MSGYHTDCPDILIMLTVLNPIARHDYFAMYWTVEGCQHATRMIEGVVCVASYAFSILTNQLNSLIGINPNMNLLLQKLSPRMTPRQQARQFRTWIMEATVSMRLLNFVVNKKKLSQRIHVKNSIAI